MKGCWKNHLRSMYMLVVRRNQQLAVVFVQTDRLIWMNLSGLWSASGFSIVRCCRNLRTRLQMPCALGCHMSLQHQTQNWTFPKREKKHQSHFKTCLPSRCISHRSSQSYMQENMIERSDEVIITKMNTWMLAFHLRPLLYNRKTLLHSQREKLQ